MVCVFLIRNGVLKMRDTHVMSRKVPPTDLSDDQRQIVKPLLPSAKSGRRPREVDLREVFNSILFLMTNVTSREAMLKIRAGHLMLRRLGPTGDVSMSLDR